MNERVMPQLPPLWVDTSEEFEEILVKINHQLLDLKEIKAQKGPHEQLEAS